MPERFLLDTSAIFTLTDRENGWETVEKLLDRSAAGEIEAKVCSISLMEIYYITLQEQGEDGAAELVGLVKSWPVTWIYPDERALLLGGWIKAHHRLSFADALIGGTALLAGAILVHKDPEFEALAGAIPLLSLPFKGKSA